MGHVRTITASENHARAVIEQRKAEIAFEYPRDSTYDVNTDTTAFQRRYIADRINRPCDGCGAPRQIYVCSYCKRGI